MSDDTQQTGQGQADVFSANSHFNMLWFLISQAQRLVAGSTLVKVMGVTNTSAIALIGTVDVLPLVNMVDGAGTAQKHETIYGLPYARVQGGKNAVICDPVVGDIGLAVFADQDISAVKAAKDQANPGTFARNDMGDGLYLFTVLGTQVPTHWVQFLTDGDGAPNGINIGDKFGNTILMGSTGVTINGVLIDRSQNVSAVQQLTTLDTASLGGGAQFLKRADGTNTTKVKGT